MKSFNTSANIMLKIKQLSITNLDLPSNSVSLSRSRSRQLTPKQLFQEKPKQYKPYSTELIKPKITKRQKDFLTRSQTIEDENKLLVRTMSQGIDIAEILNNSNNLEITQKEINAAKQIQNKKNRQDWVK